MRRLVHRLSVVAFLLMLAGGAVTAFTASISMSPSAAGMVTVKVPPPSTLSRVTANASGPVQQQSRQQAAAPPSLQSPPQENFSNTTVTNSARACNGLVREETRTEYASNFRVATTTNYQNVEGLMLSVVQDDFGTFTDYSIPQWLWDAYGGNYQAIAREIGNGRLANRRAPANGTDAACTGAGAPASPSSALTRPSCDGPEAIVTRTGEEGGAVTLTTANFRRVEGLVQEVAMLEGQNVTSYGVPAWLLSAYGGNYTAVIQEIENGRLSNRRATPCPTER